MTIRSGAVSLSISTMALAGCVTHSGDDGTAMRRDSAMASPTHQQAQGEDMTTETEQRTSALDFTMKSIDGNDVPLERYRGKVVLIVNVASKCGLTPQYEDLQAFHARYAAKGLAILGFPANDFLRQEPGTNDEIKQFCRKNYGVEFDMFAKVVVKGRKQCDLYRFLTSKETNPDFAGAVKWNFTKFLLDRDGKVINRFEPRTRVTKPEVLKAIEDALG